MKVAVVSTYPPIRDGIGHYVSFLYPSLARLGVLVNVISDKNVPPTGGLVVLDTWHGKINIRATLRIIKATLKTNSEILHFQFHPALFGRATSLVLLPVSMMVLRFCSKKVVLTFHTIRILKKSPSRDRIAVYLFTRIIALVSHRIIALTDEMKDLLVDEYKVNPQKIAMIPFGVREVPRDNSASAKQMLGLANRFCVFAPSLLRAGTGVDLILRTMPEIVRKAPEVVLIIATAQPAFRSREDKFPEELVKLIDKNIKDNVLLVPGFDALDPKTRAWMVATDLLVYLHGDYPSEDASLGICEAIAYRKPVLISEAAKFRRMATILKRANLESSIICVGTLGTAAASERIFAEIVRARCGFSTSALIQEYDSFCRINSWPRIAETMYALYKEILGKHR